MARRRTLQSISTPIILASTTVALAIALLVGWTLLIANNLAESDEIAGSVWLLVLGAISFLIIMGVLVLFGFYLAREILEVRRQDSFIDSVTHELKSPLASIKLCLETLARPGLASDQRESLRQMMLADVDRLSSFIDDVLQASRMAHAYDTAGMSLGQVPVAEVVEESVESAVGRHRLPTGAIVVDVDPAITVFSDRAALALVMKNLVDNAVKYSKDPVEVRVTAHRENGHAVIEVRDSGIGIAKKELKRVFHRFYRVEDEEVRRRKGTGLGLFVVSALTRNLGGRVEALSEGPGKGTTLRVVLPTGDRDSRVG